MSEFQKIFDAYGGDYSATISRFMGNESMYLRFLDMLFQDKSMEQLGSALESGDLAGAFAAAHTLKGVAANMGLTPLYQEVCAMVEPLRAGEQRQDYPARYQKIQEEFQKVKLLCKQLKGGGEA